MARFAFLFALAFFMAFALLKNWKRPFFIALAFMIVLSAYFYITMKHIEDDVKAVPTIRNIETVRILYSSDKKMLFNDPEFQEMLKKNYGIVPDGTKLEGSDTLHPETVRGYDGVWLSKHVDITDQKTSEHIFQTCTVLYSWHEIAKALIRQGIVEKRGARYLIVGAEKLRELEQQGRTYEFIGLSGRYDKINVLADADSEALFDRYIRQGELSYPLISAPESLVIEWYQTQPAYREKIRKEIVILEYEPPKIEPHSFVALTDQGKKLLSILKKTEVRQFISRKYGLRFGAGELDKQAADALGLPEKLQE